MAGPPADGQFRIGPHTDFGTFTILDREPGKGGLQVWSPTATGRTRRTTRTRSPSTPATCWPAGAGTAGSPTGTGCFPPQADAPDEDLVSLVYFYEANWDTMVAGAATADRKAEQLPAGDGLGVPARLLDAITVG